MYFLIVSITGLFDCSTFRTNRTIEPSKNRTFAPQAALSLRYGVEESPDTRGQHSG